MYKLNSKSLAAALFAVGLLLLVLNAAIPSLQEPPSNQSTVVNSLEQAKQRDIQCLAKNIYHEARSESVTGQQAVAWVTMNRANDPRYPNSICEVVYQAKTDSAGRPLRHQCQFSWYCDGAKDVVANKERWQQAVEIAEQVLHHWGKSPDPTVGAVMYHATWMEQRPFWAESYTRVVRIDNHVFYK